ncbi:MAG: TerD family protein [Firmicutes bacterium]|jgi:stress response protein SCP2|nr:TerD family protein [Bacillota bacterium]
MLQRGQNIKLNDIVKKNDFEIEISTNMLGGVSDVACFGVDTNNQLSDDRYFIFYNQPQSPENALNMSINGNNTIFHIDLNRLPKNINKLVLQ